MNSTVTLLRVCAATWMPWINISKTDEKEIKAQGPMADILNILSILVNFKFEVFTPEDGQWGVRYPSGYWTGMVGMVQRNQCDMILGPLASTYQRSLVLTYTNPPFITYLGILGGRTFGVSNNMFGYFSVFQLTVWVTLLAFIILISGLTLMGNTIYEVTMVKPTVDSLSSKLWKVRAKYWMYFFEFLGTLLCESTPEMPMAHSSRLVLATWWMGVIVLMNTFGGTLKASMLMQEQGNSIDSVKDLAVRSRVTPYVWKGTAYEALVKESSSPEFQAIWKRIHEANGTLPIKELYNLELLRDVQRGKKVIISDLPTMKYAASTNCEFLPDGEFYLAKQEFFGHTLGMAVSKAFNKTLLREINKRIRWLVESTLVDRWVTRQFGDLDRCVAKGGSEHKMLGLGDLSAIFYLWILCLGVSACSLIIESVCGNKKGHFCRYCKLPKPCRPRRRRRRRRQYNSSTAISYSNHLILRMLQNKQHPVGGVINSLNAKRRPSRINLPIPYL